MTAPVPDHAALPVEQIRAMLAVPQTWHPSLECGHCGDIAIWADADGCFTDGAGGNCLTCGFPGQVSCCAETPPHWMLLDEPGAKCMRPDCGFDCDPDEEDRLPPPGGNRSAEGGSPT